MSCFKKQRELIQGPNISPIFKILFYIKTTHIIAEMNTLRQTEIIIIINQI